MRPDALFIAQKMDFWLGSLAGRITGVPSIVLYLGIERSFPRWPKYNTVFSRLADRLVANSEYLRASVLENSPFIPPSQIVVIRNVFPILDRRDRSDGLRRSLGVPEQAILIGGAGRLAFQKSFDLAPDVLSCLIERWPVYLAIAGEGEERNSLEEILGDQWAVATESLGRGVPEGAGAMIRVHHVGYITWNFLIWNFLMGIALVWFYAAVRPRFGPGPKTAVFAGLAVWFIVWFLGFGGTLLAGMIPTNAVVITLIWGVFQVPIATVAGAWLYQEGGAPVPAAPEV